MAGDSQRHSTYAVGLSEALDQLDERLRTRDPADVRTVPSGFAVLDQALGGGLHGGDLVLLGGPPGVGKTIAALQWARHVARTGGTAVFACYEHDPDTLLARLLALEAGERELGREIARALDDALSSTAASRPSLAELLGDVPGGAEALAALRELGERLVLVRASGAHTTIAELEAVVADHRTDVGPTVLFVDYLQKIPLHPEPEAEAEKVTRTVEALKDLALERQVPIVLLSAVDAEGMRANRLRMHHLRGSSAIAFESDVVLMLNDKHKAVSKVHLSYDIVGAKRFREWVVWSIEKNRGGPNLIDLEFRRDFSHFRFDPDGGLVSEQLVSERVDEDAM